MERISFDILGPIVLTYSGNLMEAMDHFSKYPEVVPTSTQETLTAAEVLLANLIARHRVALEKLTNCFNVNKLYQTFHEKQKRSLIITTV